jgi:predicted RNA binding protein with dsRBD fold (UPF0201 family)
MDEVSVHVEVDVNPTESKDKVRRAVENIFGSIDLQAKPSDGGNILSSETSGTDSLIRFQELLRRERIRDAARKALFEGLNGKTLSFCLNKQVAYAGHVSFSQQDAESPLGPIKVRVRTENPRELIDWLTSRHLARQG